MACHDLRDPGPANPGCQPAGDRSNVTSFDFTRVMHLLRDGAAVARKGWNGRDMFIKVQWPDCGSKMTEPYIYLTTPDRSTRDGKCRLPWTASQADLLATDWYIVSPK